MSRITTEIFEQGLTYSQYRNKVSLWLSHGKTSGTDQSKSMIDYTHLNNKRMDRLDKTLRLSEQLINSINRIQSPQYWVVLVEAWCGDVAQNLPTIARISDLNKNIELRIIFRDENPEIMDSYLTEGSRSIPKLIILDGDYNELATWGPRPAPVQDMLVEYKNDPNQTYKEYSQRAHTWYARDKNLTLQLEFSILIDGLTKIHKKVA